MALGNVSGFLRRILLARTSAANNPCFNHIAQKSIDAVKPRPHRRDHQPPILLMFNKSFKIIFGDLLQTGLSRIPDQQ